MAAKKIGAIIALDGEREFKNNVTSCNKALSSLKSELQLVEAQYEGQENSLDALTQKHEVLSKILTEQKNKEEAVKKALDHANESYKKVGDGLQELNRLQQEHQQTVTKLKNDYKVAADQLDEMTKSGDASEAEIKKQEAVIESLSNQLNQEKDALKEVNDALARGEKNYQTAGNRVKDWEVKLNSAKAETIKATSAYSQNAKYMNEAAQSADKCAKSIDEYGERIKEAEDVTVGFGSVVKANLTNTLVDATKEAASSMVSMSMDMESAQRQLQASTGATASEMQRYESVMDNLYKNNYGEDISDIAQSMALVRQYTNEIDPSRLEEMTENGIAMRDVFDMDLSETIRGIDALMNNMGLSADEAFDLMAKGAQNGLDKSGELADNIAEYSQLWAQAGFSAEEMFAILDNGLDSGAYNLDKVNDFVKEFTISLSDGRIEENIKSFSSETQVLFRQWQTGKATAKDVFYSVINDLANATNQQEALTLASNTWSALGEDNAMSVITSLANVNDAYNNVEGTMESIKDIKYDTLESRFEQLGRKFMTEFAEPVAEVALPAIESGLDLVIDNMDVLVPLITGAAAGVGIYKGLSVAISIYQASTVSATVAQQGLNTAVKANPLMFVASALVAAGTALFNYASNAGEASDEVKLLTEENQKFVDSCNDVTESTNDTITSYKENSAEMKAQAEYAGILAGRISELASTEDLSNEQKAVMSQYIAQINDMIPELNLAYDEQTKSLNMTNEEISKYIENNQKQLEQQAAMEYAQELIKKRTELEIEAIKTETELNDLQEKSNELKEEEGMIMGAPAWVNWLAGKSDEKKSYDELVDAQEKSNQALEDNRAAQEEVNQELAAAQEVLAGYGVSLEEVTGAQQEATEVANVQADAASNNIRMQEEAAKSAQATAQQIADTYTSIKDQTAEVLDSQMNMFEEFSTGTEISKEKLLENMQSQIDGVSNWADNMATLAERGINENLLQHLAEMGPEGANYVAAFVQMTDDELEKASSMWSESLDMKSGVEESVSGMIDAVTTAINGGKDKVNAAMKTVGADTLAGLVEGINSNIEQASNAGKDVGDKTVSGAMDSLQEHSPSRKFMEIGQNVVQGLVLGMNGSSDIAVAAARTLSIQIIHAAQSQINQSSFASAGRNVSAGIAMGITAGSPLALTAAILVSNQIKTSIEKNLVPAQFMATGRNIPIGMATGINAGRPMAVAAAGNLVTSVVNRARNAGSLYSTGLNLSRGMASGISAGQSLVVNAVSRVCAAAVSTAKAKLQINSPSKVFEKLGSYTSEGFGVGYQKNFENVRKMISKSMEFSNLGQNSSGQFNFSRASGAAGDVISAINNLRNDLNNTPRGNTYNINGVTYDDGSNVSNAVESLIRATRIERRT